jgi:superfamily I DNA/RNA helicase
MLTTNYRCTGEIVNLANKVVLNSKFLIPKKMIAYNKSFGIKPNLSSFYGVKDTNIAVIEYIIYLLYDRNVPRS